MTEWLLKLMGAEVTDASRVSDVSLLLRGPIGFALAVLIMLALGGVAVWLYRKQSGISGGRRIALTVLRVAFIVLLVGLLLRPVLRLGVEGQVRRTLLLLIDGSGSMTIADPRTEPADRVRAGIARGTLDPAGGLDQPLDDVNALMLSNVARSELAKSVLQNERLALLPRLAEHYDVRVYRFGNELSELASAAELKARERTIENLTGWIEQWRADAPITAAGDGLREVLSRTRGQPLAGVVLVSDGQSNAGLSGPAVTDLLKSEQVPLYAYGVGLVNPKDIHLANLFAPDVAFLEDEVTVTVRVRSAGLTGESAKLVLRQGEQEVASETIQFTGDGEIVVPLRYTPETPGDYTLTASIDPLASEVVRDNNDQSQKLRVIDGKIKVLLVEQQPRWEYKYLQAMLLRDRRVQLKCVLFDAGDALPVGENSPYLRGFPTEREVLFEFDLVILGDVDPRNLSTSQLEMLHEYVSQFGGGLLSIGGRRFMPGAWSGTPLERLLPVEWERTPAVAMQNVVADKPIRPELTIAGRASLMLRLADTEAESAATWATLPPIYFTSPVTRAKPAAEVLLVDPDPARATRFGKHPIMALQQYGLGQVMFVGTDNTWRWRRNVGDRYYSLLWGQIIQRMALPHLLGQAKRTQLTADRKSYSSGERITVYARLYNETYQPITESLVRGFVVPAGAAGPRLPVQLRPMPEQPGMYRGELTAPAPGVYELFVESDEQTRLELPVSEPRIEMGETAMNEPLLREWADASGGAFLREEDLHTLPDLLGQRTERVRSTIDIEVWSSPLYFLLLLGLVSAEWVVRKWSQLK